jgi:hypothetical protein
MKKITYLLVLFSTVASAQHTAHWKAAGGAGTGFYQNGNGSWIAGDTLHFDAGPTRSYFTVENIHGALGDSIVFYSTGIVNMTDGFSLKNCTYVKIISDVVGQGFKIHNSRNGGVGITLTGLSSMATVENVEIYDKLYGMWIKNESNQTGCDSTQWYPHYQEQIVIKGCNIRDVNQEGIYGGSTDPSGVASERAVTCYGTRFTPRSSALKDIFIRNNTIKNTGRTGIQLSALSFGRYEVIGNTLQNNGFETSLTYWPAIWIGGEGQAQGEIAYNTSDSASRNCITFYGNKGYIHDNTTHHAGIARDINTGIVYRVSYYSDLAIEIKPTNPYTRTCFKVANNNFNPTGTNVAVYLNGAAKDFTDTGNYICNSGTVLATDVNTKFLNGCPNTETSDTTYDTVKVACQTDTSYSFHRTIYYDSIVTHKDTTIQDTVHYKRGNRFKVIDKHNIMIWTYHLSKDTVIDTTYRGYFGRTCDSIIIHVNTSKTNYGLFDNNGVDNTPDQKIATANLLGVQTIRYSFIRGKNYQVQTFKDAGLKVCMTYNWTPFNISIPTVWPADTALVAYSLDSLLAANRFSLPDFLFIANEPSNSNDGPGYVKFLTACVRIAKKYHIPVSIGGSTQDLIFPLDNYYRTNGIDSSGFLQSVFGTMNPAGVTYTNAMSFYTALFAVVPSLNLNWWNFHWYEWATGDSTADANASATSKVFPVLCDYIKKNFGLDAVTDEWGTRNTNSVLFNATAGEIRARCKTLMVYYLSDNSSLAKNMQGDYKTYKENNP